MPDFTTLQNEINVVKTKIDALNATELTAEQILYVSQTLATLAKSLGVDDVIGATAYAVSQIEAAGVATVEIVEGTANGQLVTALADAYGILQTAYDNIEPRVSSLEALSTSQESAIATASAQAAAVQLNPWTTVTASGNLMAKDRVFVVPSAGLELALPPGPSVGDAIEIVDAAGTSGTTNFTINRSLKKIQGLDENLVFNVSGQAIKLVYSGETYGWRIV